MPSQYNRIEKKIICSWYFGLKSNNIIFFFFFSAQVLLLLVKRLASLHYTHHDTINEQNNPKAFKIPSKKTIEENNSIKDSCSYHPIKDREKIERDDNFNFTKSAANEGYDEVDFISTSGSDYKQQQRINETVNKSTRIEENMGSNVSTSGGKGLSGRRTQSSSKLTRFTLYPFDVVSHEKKWERRMKRKIIKARNFRWDWIFF